MLSKPYVPATLLVKGCRLFADQLASRESSELAHNEERELAISLNIMVGGSAVENGR